MVGIVKGEDNEKYRRKKYLTKPVMRPIKNILTE
jgi:hypothetical protein